MGVLSLHVRAVRRLTSRIAVIRLRRIPVASLWVQWPFRAPLVASTIARLIGEGATMRIGAVSYLNTKPLVYGLAELAPQHELLFDLPSRLADDLAAGRLDVALIPSIEYFQHP